MRAIDFLRCALNDMKQAMHICGATQDEIKRILSLLDEFALNGLFDQEDEELLASIMMVGIHRYINEHEDTIANPDEDTSNQQSAQDMRDRLEGDEGVGG